EAFDEHVQIIVGREDDRSAPGNMIPDHGAGLHAVAASKVQVQERDVRQRAPGLCHRSHAVVGLGDDLQVFLTVENDLHRVAEERSFVAQQDLYLAHPPAASTAIYRLLLPTLTNP